MVIKQKKEGEQISNNVNNFGGAAADPDLVCGKWPSFKLQYHNNFISLLDPQQRHLCSTQICFWPKIPFLEFDSLKMRENGEDDTNDDFSTTCLMFKSICIPVVCLI